jgi:hypothetical protein
MDKQPVDYFCKKPSMQLSFFKNEKKLAHAAIIVIFLALIRSIAEVLRLHYYATRPLAYEQLEPFIIGALIAAVFLFAMVIALFYAKHKLIVILGVLTIIALLVVKQLYRL